VKHASLIAVVVIAFLYAGCDSSKDQSKPLEPDAAATTQPQTDAASQPSTAAKAVEPIQLFNGKDLTGWTHVLDKPEVRMEDVWSVQEGVLQCKGQPVGYIRTVRNDFENYVLTLEWRWPAGTPGGNNGVLVHTSTPGRLGIWPKSIEVQLQKDHAGDFWVIGTELDVENEAARKQGRRHLNLTDNSEKPMGEWNKFEITCKGNEIIVKVNGELVNHATNCDVTSGAISLQSEGAPIEYRNIVLTPIR
jgi:hypothetical protein